MRRVLLIVAFVSATAWFMLVEAVALLMSTGLADEPGDTNGFRRFLRISLFALPGLAVMIACGIPLFRNRRPEQRGFPVTPTQGSEGAPPRA